MAIILSSIHRFKIMTTTTPGLKLSHFSKWEHINETTMRNNLTENSKHGYENRTFVKSTMKSESCTSKTFTEHQLYISCNTILKEEGGGEGALFAARL